MPAELISVAAARERILASVTPLAAESVPVADAVGRRLASDLAAAGEVPPFAGSAMDGYAITDGRAGRELELAGESRAGAPFPGSLKPGQAARISTGAAIPDGATAVIRQEDAEERQGRVLVRADVAPGTNVRPAGEVMSSGQLVLPAGSTIGPAELAAAISAGAAELAVHPLPTVCVLCTGDELRGPGAVLGPGQIHNSNGPMLVTYARRHGRAADALPVPDDRAQTEAALAHALQTADVVVVSGGVSVGPHDHVKPALGALGVTEEFWGVALQPGKPTWYGTRDSTLVFGLPGNPVSAAVTFALFVWPALHALSGETTPAFPGQAVLTEPIARNPHREQAVRVRLDRAGDPPLATVNGPQGSHVITSLVGAHGLAMIPRGDGPLAARTTVPLHALPR